MSRIAAIDTATWWGGVALVESRTAPGRTRLIAEVGLRVRDTHTAHLLDLLELLLAEAAWSKSGLDAYAASRGPGSFTGLRVGLGTIRGLGLAAGRPCLGVSTLEALAEAFGPAAADRVPLLDAGRGEVYGARYDADSSPPSERVAPWVDRPERLLRDGPGKLVIFGPGTERFGERLATEPRVRIADAPTGVAAAVGRLALLRLQAGARDGEGLSPLYLRPSDAELKAPGS